MGDKKRSKSPSENEKQVQAMRDEVDLKNASFLFRVFYVGGCQMDNRNVKDCNVAHNEKLKRLSKEERVKAGLKKLAQELDVNRGNTDEPKGLASGARGKDGKMIVDMDEDCEDEQ